MQSSEPAYLTVISWPTGFDEARRIEALVGCAALDPYQAKLASRRNLPGVMASIDASVRAHVLNAMHALGILCIAPTRSEIMSYPAPETAIGVQQFTDADPPSFVVETSHGNHWTFRSDQVKLIVSGRIKSTTSRVESDHSAMRSAISVEGAVIGAMMNDGVSINRNTRVTELMDLHIRIGDELRLVRLVGPRTRIGIVGDNARPSLLDDSRPAEMAMVLMPDAQIDTEFHDFDPPGSIRVQAGKRGQRSGTLTMESWAFYSPWVGIIKQSMHGW